MSQPTADVSVRLAWADDAAAIAGVQASAWRASYAELLPDAVLDSFDVNAVAAVWHGALNRPSEARNRVLVALEHNTVVGFVLCSPGADPDCDAIADGEVSEMTVEPSKRGQGHGSRLLQAAVDTLVADRFTRAITWLMASDDRLRAFFTEAGWAPDGAHRELDLDGAGSTVVKQVRLHTALV